MKLPYNLNAETDMLEGYFRTPLPLPTKESEIWRQVGEALELRQVQLKSGLCAVADKLFCTSPPFHHSIGYNFPERRYEADYPCSDPVAIMRAKWYTRPRLHLLQLEEGVADATGHDDFAFFYPRGEELDARILMAYFMALEAEEEEANG